MSSIVVDNLVVDVSARLDRLDQGMRQARNVVASAASDIKTSTGSMERQIVSSSGNASAAQMILQSVIRRTSDQFAAGAPISTIFAEHINGVAEAAELAGGAFGTFGEIMAGPWGLAISGAIAIGSTLATTLLENATASDAASNASEAFGGAQDALGKRIVDVTKALEQQNSSLRTNAELKNIQARQNYTDAQAELTTSRQRLKGATASLAQLSTPGATDPRLAGAKGEVSDELAAAKKAVADAQARTDQTFRQYNNSRVALIAEQAAAESTATGKIAKAYDDRIRAAQREAVAAAQAGREIGAATKQKLVALEQEKAAALEAARTSDKTTEAVHRHSAARTGEASAIREAAAAEKERQRTLDTLQDKYDPATAAVRRYQDALRQIAGMKLDSATAGQYAAGATAEFVKARATLFNLPSVEGYRADAADQEAAAKKAADDLTKSQHDAEESATRTRADGIREAAHLYEDLFRGGTKAVWQDFESLGIRILSELLAKWTVEQALGGTQSSGGGLGGLIGSVGSLFGGGGPAGTFSIPGIGDAIPYIAGARATGGPVSAGSPYLVGERGPEIVVPQQSGTVLPSGHTPRAAAPGSSGHTTITLHVQANDYFDARVAKISGPIAARTSVQVVQAAAPSIARQGAARAPAVLSRQQKLGS